MTDIVKQLRGPMLPDDLFVGQWPGEEVKTYDAVRFHAADEIERLRTSLRLIAEHPVEQSGQWEVGAREMLKLARSTLEHTHDR